MTPYKKFEIPIIYVIVGIIWITVTDLLIESYSKDAEIVSTLQIYKGWAFVLVTGLMLFWLIRKEHKEHYRLKAHVEQLEDENMELKKRLSNYPERES